ncbi:MAG: hypothetical protein ABIG43_00580 [Chloroflexota bacterium]
MRKRNLRLASLFITILITLILTACIKSQPTPPAETLYPVESQSSPELSTNEISEIEQTYPAPEAQAAAQEEPLPVQEALEPLAPEAQVMTFQATDGQTLSGTFYPAAQPHAPMIVLMHWAPGNQYNYLAIAPWLQNRGLTPEPDPNGVAWLDPTWFPSIPEGTSYNVFTFTFRGCENGCQSFDQATRQNWLLDAEAALEFASQQYGVDPQQIIAAGASIGANGAAAACFTYNTQHTSGCLGAFSLSPAGNLTIPYPEEVNNLGSSDPAAPAWCLYAEDDSAAASACTSASGDHYQSFAYTNGFHGMQLIQQDLDPNPLVLLIDFLAQQLNQ